MIKRKMIFFDIDGTIIPENSNKIPDKTVQAIRKARENGHLTFINTGRTFFNVTKEIRDIGFDGYVCGCGTFIYYNDRVILAKSLPKETCFEIPKKLREYKIDGVLEASHGVYFDQTRPATGELKKIKESFALQGCDVTRSWEDPDLNFDKFVTWTNEESNFEAFYNYITNSFDYIDRGNNFGEVVPKGFSKASGIKFLQEYFNIPLEDCYAIGDSTNDLPMLEYVPNSIAMGNSSPILFDKVAFVTRDVNDDGIEYALAHFNII